MVTLSQLTFRGDSSGSLPSYTAQQISCVLWTKTTTLTLELEKLREDVSEFKRKLQGRQAINRGQHPKGGDRKFSETWQPVIKTADRQTFSMCTHTLTYMFQFTSSVFLFQSQLLDIRDTVCVDGGRLYKLVHGLREYQDKNQRFWTGGWIKSYQEFLVEGIKFIWIMCKCHVLI